MTDDSTADGLPDVSEAPAQPGWTSCSWLRPIGHRLQGALFVTLALALAGGIFAVGLRATDVGLYQRYAKAALSVPLLHSLPKEYPALSVVVFLVPQLVAPAYPVAFGLLAGLATVGLVVSSDGLAEFPGWSRRTGIYLLLGTAAVVFARYDIFPVLCSVLAVEAARQKRWSRAWGWAVVGGLLKLFPFLLLPGFLAAERSQTGKWALRRPLVACLPVGLVLAVQTLLSPGSAVSPLRYELRRGFELSSLQGSLTFLSAPLHGHWLAAFGSVEIVGHWHFAIGLLVTVASLVALGAAWLVAAHGRLSVEAVSLVAISVAVLGDKAFAEQYLIWLIPLWAYWPIRRGWVATALLTTAVYPFFYGAAHGVAANFYLATAAASLRNALLIVATARWLMGQLKVRHPAASEAVAPRAAEVTSSSRHVNSLSGLGAAT